MKLRLGFNKVPPLSREMTGILRRAVKLSLLQMKSSSRYEVSLTLTNDEEIRQLNRIYRSLDRPTDVLSFPLQEGGSLAGAPGALLPLGDIVISLERAQSQAKAYGHSFHRELAFLTVHGMLHLLGLDHQEAAEAAEMERQQQRILAGLGISRQ